MPNQTTNGKAFEYALLIEFYNKCCIRTAVNIIENEPYRIAFNCFNSLAVETQGITRLTASFAINYLIDLEPRLTNALDNNDILSLELQPDSEGQSGDVRDVLAIRVNQEWEIGISAKNNHRAVKHSRLSNDIDFGTKWLNMPCSQNYFNEIKPIFDYLKELKTQSNATAKWSTLGNYHISIYKPVLEAFKNEVISLSQINSVQFSENLLKYLIGHQDFYKIIKTKNKVEIQAFNLNGTLNKSFRQTRSIHRVTRLRLPTRLIDIQFGDNSLTTLKLTFDEGWAISFRIHNASSRIEPSLKFDINLISTPHSLFTTQIIVNA